MKKKIVAVALALVAAHFAGAAEDGEPATLGKYVAAKVLPWGGSAVMSAAYAVREIDALDVKCDEAWCALKSRAEYEAYRKGLKAKMMEALETLLAQNRVSLAKERESNFCLKHNLTEAIKTAGKKYAKALTKGYELEIAKSDKKIAQLEKRIEKKEIELGLKKAPKKKK